MVKVAWVSLPLDIKLGCLNQPMSKWPCNSKIRHTEPASQANAPLSQSCCFPVIQRREILGQIHSFHKAHFISFLCFLFKGSGMEPMSSSGFQRGLGRGQGGLCQAGGESLSGELGLDGLGIWTCDAAGRRSHHGSDEQRLCSSLPLSKHTAGWLIFLKSLSFKNQTFF